ncbi:hypothetical protein K458DRAFT_407617 [Lentithecium fluviatile CBS 122367]|uniref:Uncharacterized protein n=1 Tax=Lentithecium fluviatile CBS 122367 TaxID=1168545 RepID=A0A6G1IP95_9PLEO|nr:hypothetical protein K458DRAFT_407617 [Lentithecium fluviatile CBS 122367]
MGDGGVEVNVAIVALIVSLIALVVTLNQLLLQLFNSADGYRRCAESVIDVWHVKRHRVWKWSEFRFETQYVTPQIVLASWTEVQENNEEFGEIYLINSPNLGDKACKELDSTVHQDYGLRRRKDGELQLKYSSGPVSSNVPRKDTEKAGALVGQRRRTRAPTRIRTESDPLVSWLRLLRELHQLSHSYWPDDCPTCEVPTWDKNDTGVIRSEFDISRHHEINEPPNHARTDIAVIYRTWTWDFMPPDMALDPEIGKMQADGNGFSLTATDVRGLGIVLRFTAAGSHDRYPRIIPSCAADKLLLGIVPGDPVLVGKDFPMMESNGTVRDVASPGGILSNIGFPEERRDEVRHHSNPEVNNDVITLLLPFLPLKGSTMTSYCFPGWHSEPGIRNVHCYWEGRIALHRRLSKRRVSKTIGPKLTEELESVLVRFDFLEKRHGDDWYARWNWTPSIRNRQDWQTKLGAISDAREIFDWTTEWLVRCNYHLALEDGITTYAHLVAAHANMADYAVEEAKAFMKDYPHDRSQQAFRDFYRFTADHGYFVVITLYEVASRYVDHLHHPDHGVAAYLKGKGIALSDDEVEAAWWVMQLRGITWNFSTWHPDGVVSQVLGQPVPSSFYGNKSPVWIT